MGESTSPRLAGVQFYAGGKIYHFDAAHLPDLEQGDFVIVETTRGRQIGRVMTLEPPRGEVMLEALKPIERKATGRDMALRRYWQSKAPQALATCREIARQLELPLKVISAEYSFDGARLLFSYTAEDRVDTQALRQEVSKAFRARVEFRLIGPRDVAKLLGGYGACGEWCCCSRFLTDFGSVSIKMAKEQGISLNPQEITGMCGRLRCCLAYEYEHYAQALRALPRRGRQVGTPYGRGVVIEVLPLKEAALVQVGEQRFQVPGSELMPLDETEAAVSRAARPSESAAPPSEQQEPPSAPSRKERRSRKTRPSASAPAHEEKSESGERSARQRRQRRRRPSGAKSA